MRLKEKDIQKELASYYSSKGYAVKREVPTPIGIIDLILYKDMGLKTYQKILIEVKEHKGLKSALGQLISYERYHSDATGLGIVYFLRDGSYKGVDATFQTDQLKLVDPRLKIACVNDLLDINTVVSTNNGMSMDTKVDITFDIKDDSNQLGSITFIPEEEYNIVSVESIQW